MFIIDRFKSARSSGERTFPFELVFNPFFGRASIDAVAVELVDPSTSFNFPLGRYSLKDRRR
jgi:hypothetical protein